jgi:hypothetical protein
LPVDSDWDRPKDFEAGFQNRYVVARKDVRKMHLDPSCHVIFEVLHEVVTPLDDAAIGKGSTQGCRERIREHGIPSPRFIWSVAVVK